MEKIESIKGLKDGDWLYWRGKGGSLFDNMEDVGEIILERNGIREISAWRKTPKTFKKIKYVYLEGFKGYEKTWDIFKLNKKEIDKWKIQITLSEL